MHIIIYTKTGCPWGIEALEYLKANNLSFEERNMTEHEEFRKEAEAKSGVFKCPTFDIDGVILADSSAKELDEYLERTSKITTYNEV